jgi:hypothetical protein
VVEGISVQYCPYTELRQIDQRLRFLLCHPQRNSPLSIARPVLRPRVPLEQELRSRSILDMYHHPAISTRDASSIRSTGSLYFDYSEDFENLPSEVDLLPALCPVPQRAGSLHHPMNLRAEEDQDVDELSSINYSNRGVNSIKSYEGTSLLYPIPP